MGVYYSGVRNKVYEVDGYQVIATSMFGKRPALFASNRAAGRWNAFLTRSERNAQDVGTRADRPVLIMDSDKRQDHALIAYWDGRGVYHDEVWDRYYIGRLRKDGRKYVIDFLTHQEILDDNVRKEQTKLKLCEILDQLKKEKV